jgi:S-sulfo-L-cysteine synthase (O-acetyl-L-serine-dependent)
MSCVTPRLPAVSGEPVIEHPVLDRIGRTPLVQLRRIPPRDLTVLAKLESANPGGSVKDRAARGIVLDALGRVLLPQRRLLDSTSGNTGIAYAMLGAALGFGVTLCLPANASVERKRILRAYGVEVIETDALEGSDGARAKARELAEAHPEHFAYVDQYANLANPKAHELTTGPEIIEQLAGRPLDLFVAGLGTSGTFVGISRYLSRVSPRTLRVAVEPDEALHGIEGLKHMASAVVPPIFEPQLVHRRVGVATEAAQDMARRLAREEGLLVGVSSGAALVGALRVAEEMGGGTAVVIFPDGGERYLSDRFWDDEG